MRGELSSEVGVVGQRVTYSNGTIKTEDDMTGASPTLIKSAVQESVRALKHPKGQSIPMRQNDLFLDSPNDVL